MEEIINGHAVTQTDWTQQSYLIRGRPNVFFFKQDN